MRGIDPARDWSSSSVAVNPPRDPCCSRTAVRQIPRRPPHAAAATQRLPRSALQMGQTRHPARANLPSPCGSMRLAGPRANPATTCTASQRARLPVGRRQARDPTQIRPSPRQARDPAQIRPGPRNQCAMMGLLRIPGAARDLLRQPRRTHHHLMPQKIPPLQRTACQVRQGYLPRDC